MKKILTIAALTLSSTTALSAEEVTTPRSNVPTEYEYLYTDIPEPYDFINAGGTLSLSEELSGYHITTNKPLDHCVGSTQSHCKKVMVRFYEEYQNHTFYFNPTEFGTFQDWLILFQDWVLIKPEDTNGNHPITTIKIFKEVGKYYLGHFENSWQWDDSNYEPHDPYDLYHTHPDMEVERGRVEISEGKHYRVDFTIDRGGYATLFINGVQVSSSYYQTKSPTEQHVYMIGAYWNNESIHATPTKFSIYNFGY